MSYFPFFMQIENADCLIVGGGKVALRKAEKLLPYGPRITVAAPEPTEEFSRFPEIKVLRTAWTESLAEGRDFVIAATDCREVNREVSRVCRERKIPVNVVDDRELCTFLFPSLVKNGELSIGISTGGASPSAAVYAKEKIREAIPDFIGELIEQLDVLRPLIRQMLPEEEKRAAVYKKLFAVSMERGKAPAAEELQRFLEEGVFFEQQ